MAVVAAKASTAQEALASLLDTELASPGLYARVYGHRPGKVNGESPVLFVVANGERRAQPWAGTPKFDNYFRFLLVTCIADADETADYPRAEVELKITDCQQAVAQVISDNRTNANWNLLTFVDEFSTIEALRLDNYWYWVIYQTVVMEIEDTIT